MALESIPEVRQHILEVMSEAVGKFFLDFDEETGRFHGELEGPPAPGAKPEDIGWFIVNQDIIHPLALPVAWRGPIVMNTQEELQQAYSELRDGTFIRGDQSPGVS